MTIPIPDSENSSVSLLRQVRTSLNLTLRDVSNRSGLAFSYISNLERGNQSNPTISVARSLSRVYGLTVDELFPEHVEAV